jgi:hypothetical protein
MNFRDVLYLYRDGIDRDVGPSYLDQHNTAKSSIRDAYGRPDCEPYEELPANPMEKVPDIRARLERAGMKKRNAGG